MDDSAIPTLTTDRLTLRPFELTDAPLIQQFVGAREVAATTLNIPHPYEDDMAEAWMQGHLKDWLDQKNLVLAISNETDGLVGAISLKLEMIHRRAELGYWIGVPFWNLGYATEAAAAIMQFGFVELSLNRIEAQYFENNVASGRVMQKLGMTHEGVLRKHVIKDGVALDSIRYGILRSEYESNRE
jgi:ribosomal-protein-alanine N-acetyltransferase